MSSLKISDQNKKWIIVQLSPLGEKEKNTDLIARMIRRVLCNKTIDVFIPAISEKARDESHTVFYMEGYIFVEYIPDVNYLKLQETPYFKSVIIDSYTKGKRSYSLIDDSKLNPMRVGMEALKKRAIDEGDSVKVIKGAYKNLIGKVVMVREENELITIDVGLYSKPLLIEFPASFLKKE